MPKKLITRAIVGLALLSSAYASDKPDNSIINTELSYCQKEMLRGEKIANVDLAKIIQDTYSIQHHKEYQCEAITEKDAVAVEKSELYAFLLGMQMSSNILAVNRIEKAKMSFFYEVIVSKAIESDIDTVAGIQKKILGKNEIKEIQK